jgi:hypothetical protein
MVQLADQRQALKSATYSTIQGRVIAVNKYLVAEPTLVSAIKHHYPATLPSTPPMPRPGTPTPDQTEAFADVILTLFEELYYQYNEFHLVRKEIWKSWESLMRDFKKGHQYLDGHLQYGTTHYSREFRSFFHGL